MTYLWYLRVKWVYNSKSPRGHFLWMGVTLASFQKLGTLPCAKEKLKSSQIGKDRAVVTSLRSLLFIQSGPAALPVLRT